MVAEPVRVVDDVVAARTPVRLACDRPHWCAGDGEDPVGVVPAHEGSVAVDDFAGTLRGLGAGSPTNTTPARGNAGLTPRLKTLTPVRALEMRSPSRALRPHTGTKTLRAP
jgi:hypothetical protein